MNAAAKTIGEGLSAGAGAGLLRYCPHDRHRAANARSRRRNLMNKTLAPVLPVLHATAGLAISVSRFSGDIKAVFTA